VIYYLGFNREVQGSKELEKYSFAAQTAAEKSSFRGTSTGEECFSKRTRFRTRNSN
jgi:hypothetical protein